ncbi:DUF943 family protein [Yersinia similis]|uniref:DUF943 family protein n=1 Tax=Yersinia similis TaxID=367190 RepID=UPI00061C326D|nr:DUF943 family protein [Yersinia similis]CNB64127.1 entero membrane protein [Yersinia similis]
MIKKENNKWIFTISGLFIFCIITYYLWMKFRPVEVIGVYGHSDIIIKNPPITDKGKITWWQDNKDIIQAKYGTPKYDINGTFSVTILDFGDGYENYREGSHFEIPAPEFYCFDDAKINCLDKENEIVTIYKTSGGIIKYVTNDTSYNQREDGEIVKEY